MSCSCGSTTCLCGIPCSCSVESCSCDACAIGLPRSCEICNKPHSITGMQTDEMACSCFVKRATALISDTQDNPQFRMVNLPIPTSDYYYVHAKLVVNIMSFSQFIPQQQISVEPTPQSTEADYKDIPLTFLSEEDVITPRIGGDSAVSSTAEVNKSQQNSSEQSNDHASTSIGSSDGENTQILCEESRPNLDSECTIKTDNIVQNVEVETEGSATGLKHCFYLPSIKIGDVSYPVDMADPVWRLPHPAFSAPGFLNSSMNLHNPFYVYEAARTVQAGSVPTAQNAEEPLNSTQIKEQSNLKIHDKHGEFATSSTMTTGNEYTGLTRNSSWNILPEQPTYSMVNRSFPTFSDGESSPRLRELFCSEYQPSQFIRTSGDKILSDIENYSATNRFGTLIPNNFLPKAMATFQNEKSQCPLEVRSSPLTFSATQRNVNTCDNPSMLQILCKTMDGTRTSEQNAYLRGIKHRSAYGNKENFSMPFYVDTSTTQKMVKLLRPTRN